MNQMPTTAEILDMKNLPVERLAEIEAHNVKAFLGEEFLGPQFSCEKQIEEFLKSDAFSKAGAYHMVVTARYADLRKKIANIAGQTAVANVRNIFRIINAHTELKELDNEAKKRVVRHWIHYLAERLSAAYLTGIIIGQYLIQNENKFELIVDHSKVEKTNEQSV